MTILQELHNSEINCGIQCFYDSCWTAWIEDEFNNNKVENASLETENQCHLWLKETAIALFPNSTFTKGQQR